MPKCRTTPKNNVCDPASSDSTTITTKRCAPFSVCLPFGRTLVFDGECLYVQGDVTIPDGEYNYFTLQDGCVISGRLDTEVTYTPAPCAASAPDCNGSGSDIIISPIECNLLSTDAAGRWQALLNVTAGDGITLSGCGSDTSPLIISAEAAEAVQFFIRAATPDLVSVTGSGMSATDPVVIEHTLGLEGTYNGMTFDAGGHFTQFTEDTDAYLKAIVGGNGITVEQQGTVAIVGLALSDIAPGTYQLGAYAVTFDLSGRATNATRNITTDEGTLDPFNTLITINEFGSIIGTQTVSREAIDNFSRRFEGTNASHTMSINLVTFGKLRVSWRGILPGGVVTTDPPTYVGLTDGWSLTIDGNAIAATAMNIGGFVVQIDALSSDTFAPGAHSIVLASTADPNVNLTGVAFMDVLVVR